MSIAERIEHTTTTTGLSYEEIGTIVDASERSVQRWARGQAEPQRLSRQLLIQLAYVADQLSAVLQPEERNLWMHSPNRLLEHESPADRIRAGDYKSVVGLIDALADGIVV